MVAVASDNSPIPSQFYFFGGVNREKTIRLPPLTRSYSAMECMLTYAITMTHDSYFNDAGLSFQSPRGVSLIVQGTPMRAKKKQNLEEDATGLAESVKRALYVTAMLFR